MNVKKVIPIIAPPAPRCFETRDVWVSYLVSAQQQAGHRVKPFNDSEFNARWSACVDCPAKHAHAMFVAKRCDWKGWLKSIAPVIEQKESAPCSST